MNAVAEAPPVSVQHVRDRLTAWIAERRLPEPAFIRVTSLSVIVEVKSTADLVRWAWVVGRQITVSARDDRGIVCTWLSGDPLHLGGAELATVVVGPDVSAAHLNAVGALT